MTPAPPPPPREGEESETAGEGDPLLAEAGLSRVAGALQVSGVLLGKIADAVGTPVYVYNTDQIRAQYHRLQDAFSEVPRRICYAVKANSSLAILRVLRDMGAGADLVSSGELHRALEAGFTPDRLILSGVGKTLDELRTAIAVGVGQINVESIDELARLRELTLGEAGVGVGASPVNIGLRINPGVFTATHPYIATGDRSAKFGVPQEDLAAAADLIRQTPTLRLSSLAVHLGSQVADIEPYVRSATTLLALLETLRRQGIDTVESIDLGGGFAVRYDERPALDIDALGRAIAALLGPTGLTVILEPGRFLVGSAGVLVTEVQYRKGTGGKTFLIVDGGMSDLLRPALYQAYHHMVEVEAQGRSAEVVDVVGPACETGDFLALARRLPEMRSGERLAILGAGAYGFVMSSNYNSRPRAPEVVVDGDRFAVARRREALDDLIRGETPDPRPVAD